MHLLIPLMLLSYFVGRKKMLPSYQELERRGLHRRLADHWLTQTYSMQKKMTKNPNQVIQTGKHKETKTQSKENREAQSRTVTDDKTEQTN